MWPFKKKNQLDFDGLASQIESLSHVVAKSIFIALCRGLGEKVLLVENKNEFSSTYELNGSVLDFFEEYSEFNPRYMDLNISVENIGGSEIANGYTRIGYGMEWSEVACESSGKVFTIYSEDSDGVAFEKSDQASSIWHYMLQQLSVVYPEVVIKTLLGVKPD